MKQGEIDFRKEITDSAIKAAEIHANVVHDGWSERAYDFLKGYAEINPVFMAEDVRNASKGVVPSPPTERAWGAIIRKASVASMITHAGYRQVKNVRAHHANASVWKSLIVKY
jgi:hypothetical protein